jgi:hypothetical protein
LAEIIIAVFEELDVSSRRRASFVCRAWSMVGIRMLWRSTTSGDLLRLPTSDDRRQTYARYVRQLDDQAYHASVVSCRFPQLRSLFLPGFSARLNGQLLRNCGQLLTSIRILSPKTLSASDPPLTEPPLCAAEVAMLVQLPAHVQLSTKDISLLSWWENHTTDGSAAATDLMNSVVNPFPALRRLLKEMYVLAMPLMLPLIGHLTKLLVEVDDPYDFHVLPAVASSSPLLQVLHMKFLDHGRSCGIEVSD